MVKKDTNVIIVESCLLNPCSLRNSLIKFKVFKKITNVTLVYFLYQEPLVKNMSYIIKDKKCETCGNSLLEKMTFHMSYICDLFGNYELNQYVSKFPG